MDNNHNIFLKDINGLIYVIKVNANSKLLTLAQKLQYEINADLNQLIKHDHDQSEKGKIKKTPEENKNKEPKEQLETNTGSIILTDLKEYGKHPRHPSMHVDTHGFIA